MADTVNARDLTIQAQLPRLIPITMPGNITVPTTNVPGLPDYYASSKQLELRATSQIFQISKVGGISPSAIILTALKRNILGTVTWTVLSGTVTYTTGNDTLTVQAGGLTSDTATIRASVTSDSITYTDVMTIVRVQEGIDSVTGFLTNESTSVPALADGGVLSYDNTGGQFRVLKGVTDVTGTAVTYSVVSSAGVNVSIATTGVYTVSNLTVDAGSAIIQASYSGVNIQKVYTITKSKQGAAGITTYTWIKYADSATGAGLSDSPTGKSYIGLAYNKTTPTESSVATDYEFSLIKGTDGVPGTNGTNGVTTYTWIKYSDYADGTSPYDTPTSTTLYIGLATNKTTATESTVKTDYVWSKFKGDQGVPGQDGVTTYTWIKYADNASGSGLSDSPTGKTYIGFAFNKITPVESTNPTDYSFSLIKGTDGIPGTPGADGVTLYTWIKYSDFSDGTSPYDVPTANTLYIGIATNKTTATESTNKADYTWSKFKGDQGVPGANGTNGTNGVRGNVNIAVSTTGSIWSDTAATNGIANAGYGVPQSRDIVTLYNTSTSFSQSKFYDGSAWQTLDAYINGNLLVDGSVFAQKVDTRGLSIKDASGNVILSSGTPLTQDYANIPVGGKNLIPNSGPFPDQAGFFNTDYNTWPSTTFGKTFDPYRPKGYGGVYVTATGTPSASLSAYVVIKNDSGGERVFPVTPGQKYEASVYISAHRCTGNVQIVYLNTAGSVLSTVSSNVIDNNLVDGTAILLAANRAVIISTAPAGASYAIYRVVATGKNIATPYMFICQAYFGSALPQQTTASAWSDSGSGQITASNATTYIADATIALAKIDTTTINQLSALSATIGTLRTATSGGRTEISDNIIKVFDASGNIRVKLGNLSL